MPASARNPQEGLRPAVAIQARAATAADLPALLALEAEFPGDRLSPRQFRYHLASPRALLRVLEDADGSVPGYGLVLLRGDSRDARLYSLAVAAAARGRGLGRCLLQDLETQARGHGANALRLEVRIDNRAALQLYESAGYRVFGRRPGYYQDGADALRLQRILAAARQNPMAPHR